MAAVVVSGPRCHYVACLMVAVTTAGPVPVTRCYCCTCNALEQQPPCPAPRLAPQVHQLLKRAEEKAERRYFGEVWEKHKSKDGWPSTAMQRQAMAGGALAPLPDMPMCLVTRFW